MNESRAPELINNPGLEKAISDLCQKISHLRRMRMYELLKQGILIVPFIELPRGIRAGEHVVMIDPPFQPLVQVTGDGMLNVVAFTNMDLLRAYNDQADFAFFDSWRLLELVVQGEYGGLVLNPGGDWAGVPLEDITRILEGTF